MPAKLTEETVSDYLRLNHPGFQWAGGYVNNRTSLIGRCLVCGDNCSPTLNSLKDCDQGHCLRCSGRKKYTEEEVFEYLSSNHPDFQWAGGYVAIGTPLKGWCQLCSHACSPTLNSLKHSDNGHCGFCSRSTKLPYSEVVDYLSNNHPNFEWDGLYQNTKTPLSGRCSLCDNECSPTLATLRKGQGHCLTCGIVKNSSNKTLTREEVERYLEANHPNFEWDGVYEKVMSPLRGVCRMCGDECSPRLANLKSSDSNTSHCRTCAQDYGCRITPSRHIRRRYFYVISFVWRNITLYKFGQGGQGRINSHLGNGAKLVFQSEHHANRASLREAWFRRTVDRVGQLNDYPDYPLAKGGGEVYFSSGNTTPLRDMHGKWVHVPI